jgi:hypothetical protein
MFDRKEKKEGRSRKGAQNKEQRIGKFERKAKEKEEGRSE